MIGALVMLQLEANLWTVALGGLFLLIIMISFVSYTLHPPKETDYFKDPISDKYGLKAHK